MKKYTIKNYKGNIVESLKKFQTKHKNVHVVEAIEAEDELKLKTEEFSDKDLGIDSESLLHRLVYDIEEKILKAYKSKKFKEAADLLKSISKDANDIAEKIENEK